MRPADAFPIDDRGSGFDNIADMLTVSPLHLSVYDSAAKALVNEALMNPAQRARIVTCDLAAGGDVCARQITQAFASRAWRRPLSDQEAMGLVSAVSGARVRGDTAEQALSLALRAVLLSPHFMFRVELDSDPTSLTPHPLNGFELATRLSYFLWSSMPDEALLSAAAAGTLSDPSTLRAQATRLLQDPRAAALIDNFAGQWLHLRAIDAAQPSEKADVSVLTAMKAEATMLFRDVAFQGAPITQLLTANYTYVNDRLASHYGLPAVGSSELVRVDLSGSRERGGLLSQGGFLTVTSHPDRTSPVKRGTWVMNEILCATVPPVPGNVEVGAVAKAAEQGLTQRQALEKHREDPTCKGCHQLMDPLGFGLENYDQVGAYRTTDAGSVIDSSGTLPTGQVFSGAKELANILAQSPAFPRCVAQKLYTYALGRTPVTDVFFSSEISDGDRHNHDDMPIILAGHGGGALHPGRHIPYTADAGAPKEKVANLLLTTLAAAGVTGQPSRRWHSPLDRTMMLDPTILRLRLRHGTLGAGAVLFALAGCASDDSQPGLSPRAGTGKRRRRW